MDRPSILPRLLVWEAQERVSDIERSTFLCDTILTRFFVHSSFLVILDNIELIFPREEGDSAMVYAFQQWIQGVVNQDTQHIKEEGYQPRTLVIGLTQDARGLDPSIQAIFDESIELDVPTPEERLTILRACTRNHQMHVTSQVAKEGSIQPPPQQLSTLQDPLEKISAKCHGYLAADMDALCTQAGIVTNQHGGRGLDQVCMQDFEDAMKSIRVSALRQNTSVQKVTPVYWTDIGGLEGVKVRDDILFDKMRDKYPGLTSIGFLRI